jgi:phage anti-repressor protein
MPFEISLPFAGLEEFALFNDEEKEYSNFFWNIYKFNDSWFYMSKSMLVKWLGYSESNKHGAYTSFIKKLESRFVLNEEYKVLDENHDLIKYHKKYNNLYDSSGFVKNRNGKYYCINGQTLKKILLMTNTERGKRARSYFLKTEGLVIKINEELKNKPNLLQRERSDSKRVLYIVTSDDYEKKNIYKIGGAGSRKCLKKRLDAYNVGRCGDDFMYYCFIEDVLNYDQIERRIKHLLLEYLDKNSKEMYKISFGKLIHFIKMVSNNYNKEVGELNLEDLMEIRPNKIII